MVLEASETVVDPEVIESGYNYSIKYHHYLIEKIHTINSHPYLCSENQHRFKSYASESMY